MYDEDMKIYIPSCGEKTSKSAAVPRSGSIVLLSPKTIRTAPVKHRL